MESFGYIGVRLATPYTRLIKHYSNQEWDMIGLYYPGDHGSELVLFDVYSSSRIRGVSLLGELLHWECVLEISTCKFYVEDMDEIQSIIATVILADFGPVEEILEQVLLTENFVSYIYNLFKKRISSFEIRQSAESIYQRTSMGVRCPGLDEAYHNLHETLFEVLKKLNTAGYDIFRREPLVQDRTNIHPLINRMYTHIQTHRHSLPVPFPVHRQELDLGEESFSFPLFVDYNAQNTPSRQLTLKCTNFTVLLAQRNADLSFLDKKALLEILKYIEACEDETFSQLESEILTEIANRSYSFQ